MTAEADVSRDVTAYFTDDDLSERAHVCRLACATGLYFQRKSNGTYVIGPKEIVRKHPQLMAKLRQYKAEILALIESSLAVQVLLDESTQPEMVICPHCGQLVHMLDMAGRKEAGRHRLASGVPCGPRPTE